MFSARRTVEKLEAISKKLAEVDKRVWIPEYHTLSEIESFNAHFEALADKAEREEGSRAYVQERLGYEELKWIDNEFRICACDYRYWSENYAFINANGQIERFKRRASQAMLLELWGERQELGFGIEQQILKARQQGISTEVELAITHQVNFGMGVNAAIASYDSDACERMFGMAALAFNEMPLWMKAPKTSDRAGSFLAFGANSTRLTQYSGRKASGIARGDTPSVIHISEVSSFPRAKEIIENSLFQSVHTSPRVFMILESTGNGNTDWWATTWYSSRDYWAQGGARLQPVFFPWFIAIDIFPGDTWKREHPVPQGWRPLIETERMMDKCAAYVHQTPLMKRWYGDGWRMPPYQAYFWELSYLEYKRKGNAKGWLQEMSNDDIEALQPKKDLVFDIAEVERQYKGREDYSVWAITGEQIPERYHPDTRDIDDRGNADGWYDRFRATFLGTVQDVTGKHSKEMIWEFVPLKQPEEKAGSIFDADCKLLVFRWPEEGYDYSVCVDPSGGTGGDNAVIQVMRRSIDGMEPDVQVAEFASNRIPQAMLHPFIMAIAALYAMEMTDVPLVAIENVYGTGDTAQIQMLEHGYKRHYKFSRLDGKNPKADKKKSRKLGWYSFDWSRTFMLGQFVNAVQNGWLKLNSPFLLRHEMPAFQIEQTEKGKVRMDHESGKHDDRIMAMAIAYIVFNDTESMSKRVEHRFVGETIEAKIDYSMPSPYAVPYLQLSDGFEGAI